MRYISGMKMLPLLACLALAACATPREACLRGTFSEVATLDRLIAETQANLSRGYRIEREPYVSSGVDFCLGRGVYNTGINVGLQYCNNVETRYREREVPIDPAAERRTLAELMNKRAEAAKQAEASAAACPPAQI